jgi:hypothetical protein
MCAENGFDRKPEIGIHWPHATAIRDENPPCREALERCDKTTSILTSCEYAKPYSHDRRHSGLPFETGGHATPRPINFSALSALALRRAALWNWGSHYTTTNNNQPNFSALSAVGLRRAAHWNCGLYYTTSTNQPEFFYIISTWSLKGRPLKLRVTLHQEQ